MWKSSRPRRRHCRRGAGGAAAVSIKLASFSLHRLPVLLDAAVFSDDGDGLFDGIDGNVETGCQDQNGLFATGYIGV